MESNSCPVLVTIQCTVYNHEPYLRQCLDGFVMQKTDFPFEAIVHDDASTDNSVAIIREYAEKYPGIIKPIYETENQYSKKDGSLSRIMHQACRGKYIAICEGDDYWTDPFKLQKQVSFLENHPVYSMCCHGAKNMNLEGLVWYTQMTHDTPITIKKAIEMDGSSIPTLSIVYRSELELGFTDFRKGISIGDYPLQIYCALKGEIMFMKDIMGVHTLGAKNSWHSTVAMNKGRYENFLLELFQWLDNVDIITDKKYHDSINYVKISKILPLCLKTNDFGGLRFHDGLRYFLFKHSFKDRIVLCLRIYYFNWLVNLLLNKRL